jgi:hypothetical protein
MDNGYSERAEAYGRSVAAALLLDKSGKRPPRQFTEAELIAICALAFDAGVKAVSA